MRLTTKIFLAIASTFIVFAMVLFILSQTVLLVSYKALEEEDARRNAKRAVSSLEAEIKALGSLNVDWGSWDETYEFMAKRGDEYIRSTLNVETLVKQRLNIVAYIKTDGKLIYGKSLDYKRLTEGQLPSGLITHIAPGSILLRKGEDGGGVEGVVIVDEKVMIITSYPVLTSEGKGPVRGTLIMGRYLDEEEVKRLEETVHMPVSVDRLKPETPDEGVAPEVKGAGDRFRAAPVSDDMVAGWGIVDDIYGTPALIIRVDLPRSIYMQGKRNVLYFILYLLVAAAASTIAATIFLKKSVLSRLISLGSNLVEIGRTGKLSMRVAAEGMDELSLLGNEVNRMLGSLEVMEAERMDAEVRLRKAHNELEDRVKERTADLEEANIALKDEISQRMRMEGVIREMAYHDSLTGLPNRMLFMDRLNQVITRGQWRKGTVAAVLFFDLDNFKVINDTLGHASGDELIKTVAGLMGQALRDGDTVARFGGDEFAMLLQDLARVDDIPIVIDKVLQSLKMPISLAGQEVFINASIGVAVYPHDGNDSVALLKNADIAMYHAKGKGGNNFQMYNPSMAEKAMERLTIGNKLRVALDRQEFLLFYQPILDLDLGKITGAEALIRWQSPDMGLVSPANFIPLAEESGLIVPIGEWGLMEACAYTKRMHANGFPDLSISVNISVRFFMEERFVDTVASVLRDTGLDHRLLNLEITESLLMTNVGEAMVKMNEIKKLGVGFSIDDFGTGYSSLSYLKSLPISQLKIDRSFIRDTTASDDSRLIVTAMIKLAQSLRLDVVAEGVETREQLDFLISQGCRKIQGYLFSKPLPADAYAAFLKKKPDLVKKI